jgi:hypothetical protein
MGLGVPYSQHFETAPDGLCMKPEQRHRKTGRNSHGKVDFAPLEWTKGVAEHSAASKPNSAS